MSTEVQAVLGKQRKTFGSRLDSLLSLLAGGANVRIVEQHELRSDSAAFADTAAVALLRAEPQDASMLKGLGFAHVRAFHVCPSAAQPRWVFPSGAAGCRALEEYVPHRLSGEFLKLWMRASLLSSRNLPVIATRQLPILERELSAHLRQQVQLAFSLGTPGAYNKITATVLDCEHRVIAFAKIASLPFAQAAALQEERTLRSLEVCPALAPHIPQVLASFELNDARVLVTSAGPKGRPPSKFGTSHAAFLQALAEHSARTVRFEDSRMWRNMQAAFACMQNDLNAAWRVRLQTALEFINRELGDVQLPMRIAQRDFVPWNMRSARDGSLYVFDWEFAEPEYTPLYDQFQFEFMARLLLRRRGWTTAGAVRYLRSIHEQQSARVSLLFLTFLVDISIFYFQALIRRNGNREQPDDLVLPQTELLLDGCKDWI